MQDERVNNTCIASVQFEYPLARIRGVQLPYEQGSEVALLQEVSTR